jgi:hypothetical protein
MEKATDPSVFVQEGRIWDPRNPVTRGWVTMGAISEMLYSILFYFF